MQSNATIQTKLTGWIWVNAPVHSVPSGERSKIWDRYQTILSLITQISQSWQCSQTRPSKQNLHPEYELMHQFTVYQEGKGAKYEIIIKQFYNTDKSTMTMQTNATIQTKLTSWVWVNAPVHSVPRGKRSKIWDHYQTILSLITQISQSWQCSQTRPSKQNLHPEYELMHQFTVYQEGKGAKYEIIIKQFYNTDKSTMTMQTNATIQTKLTSWVWVNAPVHSVPRGKRSKIWDHYQTILSLITQISQSWQCSQTRPSKQNLHPEYELMHQFTVYQEGKGAKYEIIIKQFYNTDKSTMTMQTNATIQTKLTSWVWVNAPVHSVPRGKRSKIWDHYQTILWLITQIKVNHDKAVKCNHTNKTYQLNMS